MPCCHNILSASFRQERILSLIIFNVLLAKTIQLGYNVCVDAFGTLYGEGGAAVLVQVD